MNYSKEKVSIFDWPEKLNISEGIISSVAYI